MKVGVSAFAWTAKFDRSHLDLFPIIREIGLTGLEIPMFSPSSLPVADIRRASKASGVECTVCAILPKEMNPISPDAETRRKSLDHLKMCIAASADLGAGLLGGPLYAPIGYLPEHRPTQEEWRWAVEAFQSLGDALDSYKITLSIEPVNRSETFFLRTAKDAKTLCEVVGHPRIGVTIDTFHANIEEQSVPGAILSLDTHLRHIHVSENDRGLLGQGHVDFPGIVAALERIGYSGYLMIEGFGYSAKEKTAPGALWADMDVTPAEIATKGAQYLKGLLKDRDLEHPAFL